MSRPAEWTPPTVVCGTRDGLPKPLVFKAMTSFDRKRFHLHHVVVGSHKGVDALVFRWAVEQEKIATIDPAEWSLWDLAAGPMRNEHMATYFKPKRVLAFPGGSGTTNMRKVALSYGIELWVCEVVGHRFKWVEYGGRSRHSTGVSRQGVKVRGAARR